MVRLPATISNYRVTTRCLPKGRWAACTAPNRVLAPFYILPRATT
jgi:hypothetical protein